MANGRLTHVRYKVVAWICSLSIITYFDRVCISVAAPHISTQLGLTPFQMGVVFSAFAISYALFEVPTGWLGDRIGARKVITRIVVWWSFFTMLTGAARQFWTLVTFRFLFGAGEAGMYPNSAKVFSRWLPQEERGFATGLMWMFGRLGGAFTPAIVVVMIAKIGWRATFCVFGAIGITWAVVFWSWFRDTPRERSGVNDSEAEHIERGLNTRSEGRGKVAWGRLLQSANLWAICLQYFCVSYGWWFYITWLPAYLKTRGVSMLKSGVFGGMPLLFGCGTRLGWHRFGLHEHVGKSRRILLSYCDRIHGSISWALGPADHRSVSDFLPWCPSLAAYRRDRSSYIALRNTIMKQAI